MLSIVRNRLVIQLILQNSDQEEPLEEEGNKVWSRQGVE